VEHFELLCKVAEVLEKFCVPYIVVGSSASAAYGEPRFTNDIDIVVDLQPQHVESLCTEFPGPDYYLSRTAVESAIHKRFQFNLIHPASGLKVDFILSRADAYDRSQLQRAKTVMQPPLTRAVRFAAPEDVIIKKLEYFRLGESEKHIRDICGVLRTQGDRIDREYIRHWANEMGLNEIWDAVLARLAAG
jgi:hypothetical protein